MSDSAQCYWLCNSYIPVLARCGHVLRLFSSTLQFVVILHKTEHHRISRICIFVVESLTLKQLWLNLPIVKEVQVGAI